MKSEPETFSIADLERRPRRTEHWDGVRNYQARNYMREMRAGDRAFFYHSNCDTPGIVGTVTIVREAYPDFTALDPDSPYYDPRSAPEQPRWYMVDVRHERTFGRTITLRELKSRPELDGLALLKKGSRLSVMPVSAVHWRFISTLE
jgi:predicted RNA-binding protein with PUA-like domain